MDLLPRSEHFTICGKWSANILCVFRDKRTGDSHWIYYGLKYYMISNDFVSQVKVM